jgi:hypothetical protein
MFRSAVSSVLVLVAVSLTACTASGSKVEIPKTPGTCSVVVEQGTNGHGPKTSYSGPASFNTNGNHFEIICWTDSTYSERMVTLFHGDPITAPGSWDVYNLQTAQNNPMTAPQHFVVTDLFTSPTATPFGGTLDLLTLTATTATAQFGYSDGTYSPDGAVNALLR